LAETEVRYSVARLLEGILVLVADEAGQLLADEVAAHCVAREDRPVAARQDFVADRMCGLAG
jgi:hypothetical protein